MIYLDHNATSPMRPAAREAMLEWLEVPANPSSVHQRGQAAASALEQARAEVAALFGVPAVGVVFTSGATEAAHLALWGLAHKGARRFAVGAVEHPCVPHAAQIAARAVAGQVVAVPVDENGQYRDWPAADVIATQLANHETGVVQPIPRGARYWVCDATQALGKVPLPAAPAVWLGSAHKLGGPPGIGVLALPDGEPFPALLGGGSQERGRRAGTVATALAVGFGVAAREARMQQEAVALQLRGYREALEAAARAAGGRIVGERASERLPNTVCVVFDGLVGESLVHALDLRGVCASAGAACSSGSSEPSKVLRAMGDANPRGVLRLSLGHDTQPDEVARAAKILSEVVQAQRQLQADDWLNEFL